MKFFLLTVVILATISDSCRTKPKSLQEQLTNNFSLHLKNFDSTLILDSFNITRIDTITPRLGLIVEDSMYGRQRAKIEGQLVGARSRNKSDSVDFFLYEINYLNREMDSQAIAIQKSNVSSKFGVVVDCMYVFRKQGVQKTDSVFYLLDFKGNIMNTDMIDKFIKGASQRLQSSEQ